MKQINVTEVIKGFSCAAAKADEAALVLRSLSNKCGTVMEKFRKGRIGIDKKNLKLRRRQGQPSLKSVE